MAVLSSRRLPVLGEAGRTTVVEVPAGRSVIGEFSAGDEQSLTNVHLSVVSLRLKQKEPDLKFPPLDPSLSDAENFDRWKLALPPFGGQTWQVGCYFQSHVINGATARAGK